jgi:PAS domain S-box-containing protein
VDSARETDSDHDADSGQDADSGRDADSDYDADSGFVTRSMQDSTAQTIRVLYVDPEGPPSVLSAADDVALSVVPTAAAARDRLGAEGPLDCVVGEYELPDATGLDLLESLREDHPNLPFVVFTGSGSETVASEAIGMGATDYLPKSAGGERLRERVGRAVAATSFETESGVSGDRVRELTNAFPDIAFLIDEDGQYLEVLSGAEVEGIFTIEQERLIGKHIQDEFDPPLADRFLDHVRTTLETGSVETIEYRVENSAGERWYEGRTAPLGHTIDGREAVVWVARDVTDRVRSERELAQSRDELTRLNRINGLIHSLLQSLIGSATREEIECTVCEGLANSKFYQFAWVGGPWVKDERMNPSVVAGADRDAVERLVEATSSRPAEANSFATVVRENESLIVQNVAKSDRLSDREKECMAELDMLSAALVPLTYGSTNYGVLAISGTETETFGHSELTALETLGEIAAFAINAVKNRNLIFSDTTVELEFRVRNPNSAIGRISAELDCRCELEGLVPVSDDRLIEYVSFADTEPSPVLDMLSESDVIEEQRVVSADGDCVLELVLDKSGVHQLVKAGTVVKSAIAEDGDVWYVAEAPSDVDVRTVVEGFRQTYPNSELVSKHEIDRPVHTTQEFQQTLGERLTDKQQTALQAAYFAGYYEYPRESTGEDVADSLSVSSPTLHQHLRAAQRKIVGTFLDP